MAAKHLYITAALILMISLLTGCASTSSMRSAPLSEGTVKVFHAGFDRVLTASRESVVASGLQIEDSYQEKEGLWVILAKKPASAFSWGELVRVVVEKTGSGETTVRVLTKRKMATNVTAKGDYSDSIFSNIASQLK